jgi:hypothetical protein
MKAIRVVTALALMTIGVVLPEAPAETPSASFVFRSDKGAPLSGATVAVYLEPYTAAASYHAPRIAAGTADSDGRFSFDPAAVPLVQRQAALSADRSVNLSIYAADFDRNLFATYDEVVPVGRPFARTVATANRFPAGAVVSREALAAQLGARSLESDAVAAGATETRKLAERARWVRITQQHLGKGWNGRFCYLTGRNTKTQIAVKVSFGSGWSEWSVGGWRTEASSRRAGSCFPSAAARSRGERGPMHRLRRARYEFHKVHTDGWVCDPGGGGCIPSDKRRWSPHHWKGGMRFERGRVGQAPKRRGNSFRRRPGSDFWKDHERNTEFGKGVVLVGLELNSISGYSDITKLWWLSTRRCRRNYLWGGGTDPVEARGPIYSGSRRC